MENLLNKHSTANSQVIKYFEGFKFLFGEAGLDFKEPKITVLFKGAKIT